MDGPSLPRSIRWRLQLGLLRLPDAEDPVSLDDLYEFNASLLQEQRARYDNLVEKHEAGLVGNVVVPEEETENTIDAPTEEPPAAGMMLDPLTAMVQEQEAKEKRRQELDLKYRKERARRKRGIYEGEADGHDRSDAVSFEIIDKDLHRLQPEHYTYHHSRKRLLQQEHDFDTSHKERTASLAELLHVHAREHPELGYRQGMHEIASYLLLVIEMDLYDMESAMQSSGIVDVHTASILNANYLRNDAYTMLERVMSSLSPAYDVKHSPSQSSSPMEIMGRSVVSKLKDVAGDEALWQAVKAMHVSPELYCTRWVRLMFSREVLGWRNVLLLWDIFMDLITAHESIRSMEPSRYAKPGATLQLGQFTLMQVLESTAASMILLQRDALLEADPTESIHILMNVAPLKSILPLTATLLSMMRRLQIGNNDISSSMASLSSAFGQIARDAFQHIAPTAGESLRKLSAGESLLSVFNGSTLIRQSETPPDKTKHPLAATQPEEARKERPVARETRVESHSIPSQGENDTLISHLAMSTLLKESTSTITDFLVQVKSNGGTTTGVPETVWEALAKVETVRHQLLREP